MRDDLNIFHNHITDVERTVQAIIALNCFSMTNKTDTMI